MARVVLKPGDWKDLEGGLDREWLLTNGLGGWASASIFGANTRRYHGLLVAAEKIPTERTVLLSKIDEELVINGVVYPLEVNEWSNEVADPHGDRYLKQFIQNYWSVEFHYEVGNYRLIKIVWMANGYNATYVRYRLEGIEQGDKLELHLRPLINRKNSHDEAHANLELRWYCDILENNSGFKYYRKESGLPLQIRFENEKGWSATQTGYWFYNFYHRAEMERGQDHLEDLFGPQIYAVELKPGKSAGLVASLGDAPEEDFEVSLKNQQRRMLGIQSFSKLDEFGKCLAAASDQFIVARPSVEQVLKADEKGLTIIAGYHWFTDWGRDTMIALPGLTLSTGRFGEASAILRTFNAYLSEGMLPNRFPDIGEKLEYNTADATLWFFQAIYSYYQATSDSKLVSELFPSLEEIIQWHLRGTRYSIRVDPSDGLLHAGEPGIQLTWMDVKIGNWVVTPRHGKPVCINALWCNALGIMNYFASKLNLKTTQTYNTLYNKARRSFLGKFWNKEGGYLFDVIDSENAPAPNINSLKHDSSIRPNQLFALSLPFSPYASLETEELVKQAKSIISICERELLTPYGLRTLNRNDPRYKARYTGNQAQRDEAYHNGTVWAWLLGAFVEAHLRVFKDKKAARNYLLPLQNCLKEGGIGTINEVFDAEPPHRPLGCIAQAWSVSEIMRLWKLVNE
ncbi:MAG: glycogen debranching enzyme N-terminal domain-containing protein [Chloroflexi bacterium]|uniref:Amylo-alpha-1,6-glucosidase n=1 Tax=Candidatus Chlorohelix allophototropha TaxID=3003348 RepID=A0A8T7LYA8_9CHLR|nr:glycogen debranching enzyme N-terminal domain-containing protein [Chloroflexota bacterium]WJW66291.1 amylo-alpha-1,6-glucosidase [Chloroflexota bacterium L227-S17]